MVRHTNCPTHCDWLFKKSNLSDGVMIEKSLKAAVDCLLTQSEVLRGRGEGQFPEIH